MFTGLIRDIGTVRSASEKDGGKAIEIETNLNLDEIADGASMACDGICLTIASKTKNSFFLDISGETLRKTLIKNWAAGTKVNLEPSLQLGDELGGHFVFGHVDGQAEIKEITEDGNSYRLRLLPPKALEPFIASKGSVSLDGVSLTVNAVDAEGFQVNIIPHTWSNTTLQFKKPGDALNIEADMLARYVARILQKDAA